MSSLSSNTIKPTEISSLSSIQDILSENRLTYNELVQKISTGKKYLKRSENPAATNEGAIIEQDKASLAQWGGNIEYVQGWETATDSYLQNILTIAQRINQITVEANSTINEVTGWKSLASELNTQIETLVANGNAKYLGSSLFAGVKTQDGADPFSTTLDANGMIDSVSFLSGFADPTTELRTVQVSGTTTTTYGILGSGDYDSSVFQTYYTGADGNRTDFDVFQTLVDFRKYLDGDISGIDRTPYLEGDATIDDATLFDRILKRTQRSVDNVVERVVDNGASQQKFKNLLSSTTASGTAAENRLSDVMDLDVTKAATDLSSMQSIFTASLQMASRINQMSIVNFI